MTGVQTCALPISSPNDVWVVDAPDHTRLLEVEQRFPGGGGEIVDTAIAELQTLRAVAHRSHQPKRTMRFDFTGSDADGKVTEVASAGDTITTTKAVHQPLGGTIFDSNVIELVVASLPLAPNFPPTCKSGCGGSIPANLGAGAEIGRASCRERV